jgi:type IV pilus assembly protein PilA
MSDTIRNRSGQKGFTLIELMITIGILSSLLAVAFPSYQTYVIRAQVSEALVAAGKVKNDLSLFVVSEGRFPASADERQAFEILPSDNHPTIQRLAVHGVGACNPRAGCERSRLEIKLRPWVYRNVGGGAHSQFRLEGSIGAGQTAWSCGPRDVQPLKLEWLPSSCRHGA